MIIMKQVLAKYMTLLYQTTLNDKQAILINIYKGLINSFTHQWLLINVNIWPDQFKLIFMNRPSCYKVIYIRAHHRSTHPRQQQLHT